MPSSYPFMIVIICKDTFAFYAQKESTFMQMWTHPRFYAAGLDLLYEGMAEEGQTVKSKSPQFQKTLEDHQTTMSQKRVEKNLHLDVRKVLQ